MKFGNEITKSWARDDISLFNPSLSFSDKQMSPYKISGSFNGDLDATVERDTSPTNPLGFSIGVNLTEDKITVSPSLNYQVSDKIKVFSSVALDSDLSAKLSCGAEYEFTPETKVLVSYTSTVQELSSIQESIVLT